MTFDLARDLKPEVEKIIEEIEGTREIEANKDEVELEEGVLSEDRFRHGSLGLLHSVAYQSIDLHQSIEILIEGTITLASILISLKSPIRNGKKRC